MSWSGGLGAPLLLASLSAGPWDLEPKDFTHTLELFRINQAKITLTISRLLMCNIGDNNFLPNF